MLDALRWKHWVNTVHGASHSVSKLSDVSPTWAVKGQNLFSLFQVHCWRALRPQSKPPPAPALVMGWSKTERVRGHGAASFLSSTHRLPSLPPLPLSDEHPGFLRALCIEETRDGGVWAPLKDEQLGIHSAHKLLRREEGSHLVVFFFYHFSSFFPPQPWPQNNNNGAFLPYQLLILTACVWQWAYVCESDALLISLVPFNLSEEDQQGNKNTFTL